MSPIPAKNFRAQKTTEIIASSQWNQHVYHIRRCCAIPKRKPRSTHQWVFVADTSKVSAIDMVVALIATAWSVSKRKRINSSIKLVNIASSHSRSSSSCLLRLGSNLTKGSVRQEESRPLVFSLNVQCSMLLDCREREREKERVATAGVAAASAAAAT